MQLLFDYSGVPLGGRVTNTLLEKPKPNPYPYPNRYPNPNSNLNPDLNPNQVTNYLLEKPRVVAPGQDERSFHVFYQVGGAAVTRHAHAMHMPCTCRANARVREE